MFFSEPMPHCLSDVRLIPPCDRILLEMTFSELSKWAAETLRNSLLEADLYFKARGINPAQNHTKVSQYSLLETFSKFSTTRCT